MQIRAKEGRERKVADTIGYDAGKDTIGWRYSLFRHRIHRRTVILASRKRRVFRRDAHATHAAQ